MALLEPLYPIKKQSFELGREVCIVMLTLMREHIENETLSKIEERTTKSILIEVHNAIGKKLNSSEKGTIKVQVKVHEAIALTYFLTHHAQCHTSYRLPLNQVAGKLKQAI